MICELEINDKQTRNLISQQDSNSDVNDQWFIENNSTQPLLHLASDNTQENQQIEQNNIEDINIEEIEDNNDKEPPEKAPSKNKFEMRKISESSKQILADKLKEYINADTRSSNRRLILEETFEKIKDNEKGMTFTQMRSWFYNNMKKQTQ